MSVRHLFLGGRGNVQWSRGANRYRVSEQHKDRQLVVAVECLVGDSPSREMALLDTGAEWSVIGGELAEIVNAGPAMSEPIRMSTRLGIITGQLREVPVTFLAEEGADVRIEAMALIAPEWSGPLVLGYRGFLEKARIALDPGVSDGDQWFYFSRAE